MLPELSHRDVESSTRRIVSRSLLLLLPVLGLAAAAPWLMERFHWRGRPSEVQRANRPPTAEELRAFRKADERLADAEKAWAKASTIAPAAAEVDAAGERSRWFEGFGISVESTPGDAAVLVNGKELGQTPLTASVQCAPGDEVRVEIRKPGHRTQRRATRCREDRLVELSVDLR